jgi:hypothetical protein
MRHSTIASATAREIRKALPLKMQASKDMAKSHKRPIRGREEAEKTPRRNPSRPVKRLRYTGNSVAAPVVHH